MSVDQHVDNPQLLLAMFSGDFSLQNVIVEAVLLYDGPNLRISLTQEVMPSSVPSKWKRLGYDALSFTLEFSNVEDVLISQWSPRTLCTPELESNDSCKKIKIFVENKISLNCSARFLSVGEVRGFRKG